MKSKYSVSLEKVIREFEYETLYLPKPASELSITSPEINRPGLLLAGSDEYFDSSRVNFLGLSEMDYLGRLKAERRYASLKKLIGKRPPFILITRGLKPFPKLLELAEEYGVPILRTPESTSGCMAALIAFLGTELAERITRHGVLVEVYGEGVLIVGSSGVGKSETAIELIKRGHRLIADDAVEIRKISSRKLIGSAPDNIRHFIEVRGVGVINARRIFGMGAVKLSTEIDLVVQLEPWDPDKVYDRMGLDDDYICIMDIRVPVTVVPVKPGRNLAVIIEVAAMNNRQSKMGYNAAKDLLHQLGMDEVAPQKEELQAWQV